MTRLLTTFTTLLAAGLTATAAIGLASVGRGRDPQDPTTVQAQQPAEAGPIHVRVVEVDGRPAAGVAVECRGWDRPPQSFATEADGRASIPREALGDSGALIVRRGREALAWAGPPGSAPDRPSGRADEPIVMQLLPLDHRVEGSVVDREGRPVEGVGMRPFILNHPTNGPIFQETVLDGLLAPAVTDRAGRYAMALPRGTQVYLHTSHPRYIGPGVDVSPDARALGPAVLEPAGSIVGRVIDAATGRPIAGAFLGAQLVEHRARRSFSTWVEATSDAEGRFVLGGADPGVYNVLLNGIPGRPTATARAAECVRVRAGADTTAEVAVVEGRPLPVVVVDRETGRPVPGISVGCYGPARPRSGAAVRSQKTDAQGRTTFHVPPGEQYVYLQEGDISHRQSRRTVDVPERGEVEPVRLVRRAASPNAMLGVMKAVGPAVAAVAKVKVAVVDVAKTTVAIPRGLPAGEATKESGPAEARAPEEAEVPKVRTLTGHVRDSQGRPLAGVRIQAATPAGHLDVGLPVTDRDGLFVFPGLPREPLTITLTRAGSRYQVERLPADREAVGWTFNLTPDATAVRQPTRQDEPIPPGLRDRLTFVDLRPRGTDDLSDGPGGSSYTGNDLDRVPRGIHKLGKTYFRVGERMVHLKGRLRPDLPRTVKGVAVGARGRVLHFLHAAQSGGDAGPLIGSYVIHYADGSTESIPIVYGRSLVNWWQFPGSKEAPTGARVAWTGANDATDQNQGIKIRLFDLAWANPHPEKEITSLDVLSADKESDPFLVAVTLEDP